MGEKLTISTFLCKFPILLKLCLQLNPYLPNFWWLSFPEDSDSGSYLCVFLYFKTHYHTNRHQKPTVLDLSFLISSQKTFSHTSMHSLLLRSYPGPCQQLWYTSSHYTANYSSFEHTLLFIPITLFLMSTLESQVQWSITFSLSISISPIFTFLPIQVISGGPQFQTISCYILNSSCLTVL